MKLLVSLYFLALMGMAFCSVLHRDKRWSRNSPDYVLAPGSKPLTLGDPDRVKIAETFNDNDMKLTVIKDPSADVRTCFIAELDPELSLSRQDKLEIMDAKEPVALNSRETFMNFKAKAGSNIATLCQHFRIVWLTERSGSGKVPPPMFKVPPPLKGVPTRNTRTPPPLHFKTPPPLHVGHHNEAIVKAPPALNFGMKTPPPLYLANNNRVESVHHAMKTPPPLVHHMKTPPPLFKVPPAL